MKYFHRRIPIFLVPRKEKRKEKKSLELTTSIKRNMAMCARWTQSERLNAKLAADINRLRITPQQKGGGRLTRAIMEQTLIGTLTKGR